MKKWFRIFGMSTLFYLSACDAMHSPIIHVHINKITSQTGYYCLEVFVSYDHEKRCGIPTQLGTDFINQYLIGINANPKNYIKLASSTKPYETPQPHWPSDPTDICKFSLNQSTILNVNLTPTSCSITPAQ